MTQSLVSRRHQRKSTMGTSLHPKVIEALEDLSFKKHETISALIRLAVHYYLLEQGYQLPAEELEDGSS